MNVLKLSIKQQKLFLYRDRCLQSSYPVSTAKRGVGQKKGSLMTPRGWHIVRAKIGAEMPMGTVFEGRRIIGHYASLVDSMPDHDWIMTRILWLSGLELGVNRLGDVDTMQRYIYIHGTPAPIDGVPASIGCVRMQCADVIALYDQVKVGDRVYIQSVDEKVA
jgi:L,D-transpeptidase YbiS